jgi:hypothetical protein
MNRHSVESGSILSEGSQLLRLPSEPVETLTMLDAAASRGGTFCRELVRR